MKGFLEEVAEALYARYGEGLSDRAVLFPSRRARLFFVDALSRIARQPMWQPQWVTIDDLMSEISGLRCGERIRLITELYRIYSEFHDEPFDKFYFWGDLLLNDFDTIDKYRIDARMLFRNISDLKEIEADISYLTPEQLQIIRTFWSSFGEGRDLSEEQRRFLAIWKTLWPIYERYRRRLAEIGIAYNGMVQRAAAERLKAGEFAFPEPRRYVVAGFNALSECEKILFDFLAANAETDFFWDCDRYYTGRSEQEAGMFVRQNLRRYPERGGVTHDRLTLDGPELTAVATVSNAVQCKYAAKLLQRIAGGKPLDKRTAVVLTDENLLLPLLHALPEELGPVNVTMGYPLRATQAYTFIERLIELQHHGRTSRAGVTSFYHADVTGILAHPYLTAAEPQEAERLSDRIVRDRRITVEAGLLGVTPLLQRIFRPAAGWRQLAGYLLDVLDAVARGREEERGEAAAPKRADDERLAYLSICAEEIAKLNNSLKNCELELSDEIYTSLLRRHLQSLRIPFKGEPLQGLQVMGILETRNLDFDHVVILSMTDDNFPGNRLTQASFIPYNLRAAYQLPTPEHHEGVYAYYFYRLIQRARSVHMLYCSHADRKSTGEPSRYIRQLNYEYPRRLRKEEVSVDVDLSESAPIEVVKDAEVQRRLAAFTDPESEATLSPTAFFRYVACPLRFYFASVARLRCDDELSEEVDAPMFGTILHAAVQRLYERVLNESRPGKTLEALRHTHEVTAAVEEAINRHYLCNDKASADDYGGNLILIREIVVRYLRDGILRYDAAHDDFTVIGLEQRIACEFPFRTAEGERRMKFSGIADRIDRTGTGQLRVVDYKTGRAHLEFGGVEALFHGEGKQRLPNIVQTLLYAMMLHRTQSIDAVPALYYVREIQQPDYSPALDDRESGEQGAPFSFYREPFEALVRQTLEELYDTSVPFRPCTDADTCTYCDFKSLCKR